jgi:hypothetical protein
MKTLYKVFLLFMSILISQSCVSQDRQKKSDVIIDPIEEAPYYLVKHDSIIILPDTIERRNISGFAIIQLVINKRGEIKKNQIMKLVVKEVDKTILNYSTNDEGNDGYPIEIQKYYPSFLNYLSEIQIKRNLRGISKDQNFISFMLRFRSKP